MQQLYFAESIAGVMSEKFSHVVILSFYVVIPGFRFVILGLDPALLHKSAA